AETEGPRPIRDRAKTEPKMSRERAEGSDVPRTLPRQIRNQARAAQNRQNRAKFTVVCRQGSRSLARLRDQMMDCSATREYPSLIHTFFVTHTVGGEEMLRLQAQGSNTPSGWATDVLSPPPPQCMHNSIDVKKLKKRNNGSGGCEDDEMDDIEDDDEDDEDEDDGNIAQECRQESFPGELSPSTYLGRQPGIGIPATSRPGRLEFVVGDSADKALEAPFQVNGKTYEKGYYLADGIYSQWGTFFKAFTIARDLETQKFKRVQESARKDIEKAFGDLQDQKFDISEYWSMYAFLESNIQRTWVERCERQRMKNKELQDRRVHEDLRQDIMDHLWNLNDGI
nr:hypothetical protein [Tanacetum cinerariifolium]